MSDVKKGSPALQLSAVQKSFEDHHVLCGVDLKVMPGQILGLLGKNGAGKSTLIEILCGLRQADSGSISICGMNPAKESEVILLDTLRKTLESTLTLPSWKTLRTTDSSKDFLASAHLHEQKK